MACQYTIARPYARAVFQQAVDDDRIEIWSLVLQSMALVVADVHFAKLYDDPNVSDAMILRLMQQTLAVTVNKATVALDNQLTHFLSLLLEKKRLLLATDIYVLYHQLVADYQNIIDITVTSAKPLSEAQQSGFYKALEKRFASKVSIDFQQDGTLIGGAVVRGGNWVLDGSIRDRLGRLSAALLG